MNDRYLIFVETYLSNGFNATQAAISAGYSEKTAYSQGQRLLKNVEIKQLITKSVSKLLSNTEIEALKLLSALDEIISCDIGDFVNIETKTLPDTYDEDGNHIEGQIVQNVIFNDTKNLNTRVLSEISSGQSGIKIKTQDKLKAIELKGKYLNLWADGISVVKKETKEETLTREQRRNRILELSKKIK